MAPPEKIVSLGECHELIAADFGIFDRLLGFEQRVVARAAHHHHESMLTCGRWPVASASFAALKSEKGAGRK